MLSMFARHESKALLGLGEAAVTSGEVRERQRCDTLLVTVFLYEVVTPPLLEVICHAGGGWFWRSAACLCGPVRNAADQRPLLHS